MGNFNRSPSGTGFGELARLSYPCDLTMRTLTNTPSAPLMIRLPNWVGDVCMSLPVLTLCRELGVEVAVSGRPWAADLLAGLPLAAVLPMRGRLREDIATLRAWRGAHADYQRALLLPDSLSTALAFRLAGFRSAGYRDDGRSLLLSWGFSKPPGPLHAVQSWHHLACSALRAWGYDTGRARLDARLGLPLTAQHLQDTEHLMQQAHLSAGQFVLIAPTATGRHKGQIKVWPHFDTLTRALQSQGIRVVACPPPSEQDAARLSAPTAQVLPPLGLGAYCALARQAALVICNDSGVSHLCAAVGARQLTLFGVTDPGRTGPWTPDSTNLGQNGHWPDAHSVIARASGLLQSERLQ